MTPGGAPPWRVSLHGGHSGEFCDHAVGTLREVLDAAVAARMAVFGVSEHAPRSADHLLYVDELRMGWDTTRLARMFDDYCREVEALAAEYADRLTVLRGFEIEIAPGDTWLDEMTALRDRGFDFVVGSVHHVDDILIDGPLDQFERALAGRGGLEPLAIAYYDAVADMVTRFRPDVVGHLDLVRKNGRHYGPCETPAVRRAALRALDAVEAAGCILDLNVAALRKGLPTPYPDRWLVAEAARRGVPFCFGDDSHGPDQVGTGLDAGRRYLLECGVPSITALDRVDDAIVRRVAPLV